MPIDTQSKRRSVHGYTNTLILPVADAAIGSLDREHVAWLYGGIAASALFVGPPDGLVIHTLYPIGVISEILLSGFVTEDVPSSSNSEPSQPFGRIREGIISGVVIDVKD